MKKNFVLEKLLDAGVYETDEGVSVYDLDYEELKYVWVLQSFKEIDITHHENRWF